MKFFSSLRFKVLISISFVATAATFALFSQFKDLLNTEFKNVYFENQRSIGVLIRSEIKDKYKILKLRDLDFLEKRIREIIYHVNEVDYIYISDNAGKPLYTANIDKKIRPPLTLEQSESLRQRHEVDIFTFKNGNFYEVIVPIIKADKLLGRIHVGSNEERYSRPVNILYDRVFVTLMVILAFTIPSLYFLIARFVLTPLKYISKKVRTVASNRNFEGTIEIDSSSEFEELALDFNYMNLALRNFYLDLQSLNKNLENIVFERTDLLKKKSEDLKGKNRILENTINENERMQAILVQQEKLASLGEVVAGIAHEINNPLNFVVNGANLGNKLLEKSNSETGFLSDNPDRTIKHLQAAFDMIKKNGERATNIVKHMLGHARSSKGEKEPVNIVNLIDEFLKLSLFGTQQDKDTSKIIVSKEFAPNIPLVNVVKQDIERVLLNFFNNAIYALMKKEVTNEYTPILTIKVAYRDNELVLVIRDNGTGIPEKVLEKIFDPFFTTKPTGEGTGLGMSMCHDIITLGHNGKINLTSKEGEFTEFEIVIPNQA